MERSSRQAKQRLPKKSKQKDMQNTLVDDYKYGFHKPENYVFKSRRGLDRDIVIDISAHKKEPAWMLEFRLKSLAIFERKIMPTWGGDMSGIHFDNIFYYIKPTEKKTSDWNDLPKEIKDTYDKIGIPEAEKK